METLSIKKSIENHFAVIKKGFDDEKDGEGNKLVEEMKAYAKDFYKKFRDIQLKENK